MVRTPHVSLAFQKLSIPEKIIFGRNVVSRMTSNVATFATPDVALSVITTLTNTLESAASSAATGDHQKVADMHNAEKTWDTTMVTEAHYVDRIANGNTSTILMSGYEHTPSETVSTVNPPAPENIKIKVGNTSGSVHIECDPMHAVNGYIYIITNNSAAINRNVNTFPMAVNSHIVAMVIDTHRKVDLTLLPSGTQLYLTIMAFNTAGIGDGTLPAAFKVL